MAAILRAYNTSLYAHLPRPSPLTLQLTFSPKRIRRPVATQSATAGGLLPFRQHYHCSHPHSAVLFGAGDVLAQQAIDKKGRDHDVGRYLKLPALLGKG